MLAEDQYLGELKSSWMLVVSALWQNGFRDVVLQPHPCSYSLGNLLDSIAAPSSSFILTCSGFFFQRKPMDCDKDGTCPVLKAQLLEHEKAKGC